ncbi:MAG: hypothetical protein GWN79_25570 [Actinobacteria bacterium]|nr:hypothetical protein [Actinomycetota bacterium]NIS34242.1 hypothetical protein [Actinomycetota bacterium]NIT98586.1 hypothetical protein [Actinomycetota bacterium]NIU22215.1 hypothetical protein [Actinomycetota bacterium]NIU69023.1 hypothetical protein [Actinomycetota bacterium]
MSTVASNRTADPWTGLVGQPEVSRRLAAAVGAPVHAYLFVGPPGVGKRRAAAIFAGELFAADDPEGADRHRRLAVEAKHPDLVIFEPTGTMLRVGDRRADGDGEIFAIIAEANRSPTEGSRKVVVVDEFQTADPTGSAAMLKVVEEPPPSTIFVLLATQVEPHQLTIESRCTRVDFPALVPDAIAAALVAEGLADVARAEVVAAAANGSIDRARVLATDERLATRRSAWWAVPDRLDGTGAAAAVLVEEVMGLIEDATDVIVAVHAREAEEMDAREEQLGTRGSGRRRMEARHKRELRQFHREEIRFGLATLAVRYRDAIASDTGDRTPHFSEAVDRLRAAADALIRNPNETLLLQALFVSLPPLT